MGLFDALEARKKQQGDEDLTAEEDAEGARIALNTGTAGAKKVLPRLDTAPTPTPTPLESLRPSDDTVEGDADEESFGDWLKRVLAMN